MYTGKLRIPTNRFCFKCHHRVFHSDVKDYPYVCPHCDENMYRFETYTKERKPLCQSYFECNERQKAVII